MNKLLALLALLFAHGASAQESISFGDDAGAIRGYDPVAYFTDARPVKGQNGIVYEYQGGVWHFSSVENRDTFTANPERYAPQYGGFCAYAMSKGRLASIDPEAWTVKDDKLYLNNSLGVRKTWLKNPSRYIPKADQNWKNPSKLR